MEAAFRFSDLCGNPWREKKEWDQDGCAFDAAVAVGCHFYSNFNLLTVGNA
jgi:hypothetical protein